MAKSKERHFEDEVFDSLVDDGGWNAGLADDIEFASGIAPAELLAFIGQTQIDEWNKLLVQMGNDPDRAQIELHSPRLGNFFANGTQAGMTWNAADWYVNE